MQVVSKLGWRMFIWEDLREIRNSWKGVKRVALEMLVRRRSVPSYVGVRQLGIVVKL